MGRLCIVGGGGDGKFLVPSSKNLRLRTALKLKNKVLKERKKKKKPHHMGTVTAETQMHLYFIELKIFFSSLCR